MAEEDEEKTETAPEPGEDNRKIKKTGGHTIPAQMI